MHTRFLKTRQLWLVVLVAVTTLMAACDSGEATATPSAPATAPVPTAAPSDASEPTVQPTPTRLEYGDEPDQFGWLQLPAAPAPAEGFPVVVLVHGGFWRQQFDASLMDGLATDLAQRGFASWNIEYRRVGGAGGWPATGQDVAAAIEYLTVINAEQPLDLDRVVSVGHSAGGHLALWALGESGPVTVQGSVGLGAVVHLEYFEQSQALLGGYFTAVPEAYADAAPVLDPERVVLIQGGDDSIVPGSSLRVARDLSVPIVVIDGDNHFDLIDPQSESWAAAVAAIDAFIAG